jgi:Tol biopolymer transport system component/peroxiredoxin/DNA-directed RNA polymerase subunit RPC12/RpoP
MIEFHCKNCGQKLSVQDQHSGKQVKCPKCGSIGVVPDNSDKIKFHCQNCGQSISVPQIYAGKKGKCPKCKNVVVIPTAEATPAKSTSMISFTCSMCDETVQVPETSIGKTIECPECGSYIETSSGGAQGKPDYSADEGLYEEETEEHEDSEGVDRRIIVAISATAAVVVVGLIILAVGLRSFRSRQAGRPVGPRTQQQLTFTDSQPQPVTSNTQQTEPVSLEDKLYEQTKIAFVSGRDGNAEIYVMNADGSGQERLTNNFADDKCPSWSPDGKKIAFYSNRDGSLAIYIMNADGNEQKRLSKNRSAHSPSWSPDGKRIAFVSYHLSDEIYIMNIDGSEEKCLTDHTRAFRDGAVLVLSGPCWSPDGKKIAYTEYKDGNYDIYVVSSDVSEQKRLTDHPDIDANPSWSPDGTKIAFQARRGSTLDIYVMNPDGSEQKRVTNSRLISLTKNRLLCTSPSCSPDGKKIAFQARKEGKGPISDTDIYIMNADGSKQKKLTSGGHNGEPSWSPFLSSVAKEEIPPTELIVQEAPPKPDSLGSEPRVKLIQKFPPGKYEVIQTTTDKSVLTLEGQTVTTNESQDKWYEVDASEPDASGQTTCIVTVTRIRGSDSSGSSYDTDIPNSLRGNEAAQISSRVLLNQQFVLKLGQDGKIVTISGWDRMWDGIIDEMANDNPIIDQMYQQFKQMEKEGYVKKVLGFVDDTIPDEPVGVGSVWHKFTSGNSPLVGAVKVNTQYEFRDIEQTTEGKIAHITCTGTVKQNQSKKTQFGPMSMTFTKWDMEQKGEIHLNVDTGLMISNRMEVEGEIEASVIARGRNIPANLQSSYTYTTETTTRPAIGERQSKRIAPSEPLARKKEKAPTTSRTESPLIGKPAPFFTLQDLSGKRISLSEFKGKVVILDFWATWCPPCVVEIPHFIALYEQYKDQGLAVVGISTDRKGVGIVRSFAQKNHINYPILMADGRVQAAYGGIRAIPTTFIIDSAGIIRHQYIGYRDKSVFETAIKPLLADIEPQ